MESVPYQRVKELFFEALELPAAERESFVERTTAQDPELLAELRRLLDAHDSAETFLSDPLVSLGALSSDAKDAPRFQPGMLLAGRFRILRFIASGGMGEVYEAEDLELRERVALKTIRPGIARDERVLDLFKHEIQLARRVTHPNVCRIFDLERHIEVDAEGVEQAIHFLSMELLEGQPLSQYLKENGPFRTAEALPLIGQMAEALQAAHDAGVIHQDFKPGNVILVPRGVEGGLRAVVTDFGLALPSVAGWGAGNEPKRQRGGTPGYMPPEQSRGGAITAATDVYAFGIVIAEMIGGHTHEERWSRLTTLLTASETHGGVLVHLPLSCAGWGEVLSRCVDRAPERRFQKPVEVVEELKVTDPRKARLKWLSRFAARTRREKRGQLSLYLPRPWQWASLLVTLVAAAISIAAYLWWPLVPPPRAINTVQLTNDRHAKEPRLVTAGKRIFFSEYVDNRWIAVSVPDKGGEPVEIRTPFQHTSVQDVSLRGDEILVKAGSERLKDDSLWAIPTAGGRPRRLGDLAASEARWSPDGEKLLYIRANDLYVARSDGVGSRKLVSMPAHPYFPSWSPDGKRLSISMEDPQTGQPALWELNSDGSYLHPRLAGWGGKPFDCSGRWTPDGKYFLFDSYREAPDAIWAAREKGSRFERWSREPVRLSSGPTSCGKPVPSVDGRRIFFLGDTGGAWIALARYDAATREWTPSLSGASAEQLDFSKDGKWMAYTTIPGASLVRSRLDGTDKLQLTPAPLVVACPRWSPDGKRIAFMARLPDGPWKIYIVSADGGTLQPLLPGQSSEWYPGWMPDGNSLVFKREVAAAQSSKPPLVSIVDLRSNRITSIPGAWTVDCPRLSPDGRYLAVSCFTYVMLYDFRMRRWEKLVEGGDFYYPSWSRDSQYVYFIDWNPEPGVYDRVGIRDHKRERMVVLDAPVAAGSLGGGWVGLTTNEIPLAPIVQGAPEVFAFDWQAP